ncbi:MAG TPA: glycosyltransferase 87 family protein, partial [Gaiellaceae bacterium]|nr:glycosyltransferase 87 family protein [Gaiellaceae bacterium]
VALLYPATVENIEYGAVGPVLALLVALAWRYRERAAVAASALGGAIVLKVFLWPLLVWLAATRRLAAAAGAAVVALGLALLSWAAIGFDGIADYPDLLRRLSAFEAENSYSVFAALVALGASETVARALVVLGAAALLGAAWRLGRGESRDRDRRSLTLALAAAFALTPILWLHYLVLLVVPIALARPRLSGLWLAPLALTVCELLGWYRGWPRGDGWALASVLGLLALVFALCARPAEPGGRRLAAWL